MERLKTIVALGAGSAGLLAAMAFKRAFPQLQVRLVYSSKIPVIGVGESTTVLFPSFLHRSLGIDLQEFFRSVAVSWKLGIRFDWGDPKDDHFYYPFDQAFGTKHPSLTFPAAFYYPHRSRDFSLCAALMESGRSPCLLKRDGQISIEAQHGYHIDNRSFLSFLMTKAVDLGVECIDGQYSSATRSENGDICSLVLSDGRRVDGDLFLDCSGFGSQLLKQEYQQPYVSYSDSLFCDRAVIGSWQRADPILPYTSVDTMENGWCWRIDFPEHATRGYVYSSAFCSDDQAADEFRNRFPEAASDLRRLKFPCGRYENFWHKNVIAIGNASGFVEPLEATALHLVIEQIRLACRILSESSGNVSAGLLDAANTRFRLLWDEVRDFLAIHYKFNRKSDSAFWQHCRENTDLAGAEPLVNLYRQAGPSTLCATKLQGGHLFGYDGFVGLLVGQRAESTNCHELSNSDRHAWDNQCDRFAAQSKTSLAMDEAFDMIRRGG